MIAKHITRQPGNDNFRALALYAADARIGGEKGEKTLMSWHDGCMAETYLDAMIEVEATQAMNTRSTKEKTYHLMVSFRPGDEAKLTPEILKDIEKEFAKALGFSAHQRLCGIHKNTNNIHMHIAYNMIDPENFNRCAPYYDYPKLQKVCRDLEMKYGLEIDNGMDYSRAKNETKKHVKAETIEAQTGQQSFYNYVAARKRTILDLTKTASSWKELHEIFLKMGMEIRPKGNGLVIKDRFGKHAAKASYIDRSLAKLQLEKVFGPFQEATQEQVTNIKAETKFTAAPLHQHEKTAELFAQYKAEMKRKHEALEDIKQREKEAYNSNKKVWDAKRKHLENYPMLASHRRERMQEIKAQEYAALMPHRIKFSDEKTAIWKEIPFTSWTKFLQHQAALGDETALDILRSKKLKPELSEAYSNEKYIADLEATKLSKEQQAAVMSKLGINQKHKRALVAVIQMREAIAKRGLKNEDVKHQISVNGTVIFTCLKTGGTIRDTGKEIYFSPNNSLAWKLGHGYADIKWGRSNVEMNGNTFKFKQAKNVLDLERGHEPQSQQKDKPQGLSR